MLIIPKTASIATFHTLTGLWFPFGLLHTSILFALFLGTVDQVSSSATSLIIHVVDETWTGLALGVSVVS